MRTITSLAASAAVAAAFAFATPASAIITITMDDSNCNSCSNVHIITPDDGTDQYVYGETSAGLQNVIFTGQQGENIVATGQGNGTVWVGDTDGSTTAIDIATIAGTTFSSLGFNLNEPQGRNKLPGNPEWAVRITAFYDGGSYFEEFSGFNQNTMFRVDSTGGGMQHVLIQLLGGDGNPAGPDGFTYQYTQGQNTNTATAFLEAIGQVKMDGVATVSAVPEPSTWAMMLIGFGGVGMSVRARRRRMTVVTA